MMVLLNVLFLCIILFLIGLSPILIAEYIKYKKKDNKRNKSTDSYVIKINSEGEYYILNLRSNRAVDINSSYYSYDLSDYSFHYATKRKYIIEDNLKKLQKGEMFHTQLLIDNRTEGRNR
jgi:hypothetical protein